MGRLGFILPLLLAACFVDMGQAIDMADAKAAADAVPNIEPEIESGDEPAQGADTKPAAVPAGPRLLGSLGIDQGCQALPPITAGQEILIVAAFFDAFPDADLIFNVRSLQGELADCIRDVGGQPSLETRVEVADLTTPAAILLYQR